LGRDEYFTPFKCTINSVYRSLSETYGRDASLVFYDVTNYYFEIDSEDDFKKIGVSKEKQLKPIVQMGLLIDNKGLPTCYQREMDISFHRKYVVGQRHLLKKS
jgi:hypothetical protein